MTLDIFSRTLVGYFFIVTYKRLISVDALRGMTIMLMILVNNPGSWSHVYTPFLHASWNGYTPTDLVFPFFIFIVGITTVLSCKHRKLTKDSFQKILTRTLRIFGFGLFLNISKTISFESSPFLSITVKLFLTFIIGVLLLANHRNNLKLLIALGINLVLIILVFSGGDYFLNIRLMGVLQRIALVYFLLSILYYSLRMHSVIIVCILILLGYWMLMTLIPVPGVGYANMEPSTNMAAWIDRLVLEGHMWSHSKTWDPEGLVSTLPAIATGILGLIAGYILKHSSEKIPFLFPLIGVSCLSLGLLLGQFFPINKSLWTSSFVLTTGGWAFIIFMIFYLIIDILGKHRWTKIFVSFGMNPILIYFLSGMISSLSIPSDGELVSVLGWLYQHTSTWFTFSKNASITAALIYLILWGIISSVLYRKRLFFKV